MLVYVKVLERRLLSESHSLSSVVSIFLEWKEESLVDSLLHYLTSNASLLVLMMMMMIREGVSMMKLLVIESFERGVMKELRVVWLMII